MEAVSVLLSDDFASGTFAAWDTVVGSCSIVTDPLGGGSNVAKFDCAAGDAYLSKTLSAVAPYSASFDLLVPTATISALRAANAGFTADFLENQEDGIFLGNGSRPISTSPPIWTDNAPTGSTGAFTAGVWHTVELGDDGTFVTWKVDGSVVFNYSNSGLAAPGPGWDFGGKFSSSSISGEIYYLDNVLVQTAAVVVHPVGIFDGGPVFQAA
jgi:hypothetical protein